MGAAQTAEQSAGAVAEQPRRCLTRACVTTKPAACLLAASTASSSRWGKEKDSASWRLPVPPLQAPAPARCVWRSTAPLTCSEKKSSASPFLGLTATPFCPHCE